MTRNSITEYQQDLDDVLKFTYKTFENIQDNEIEEPKNAKKMTSWNQIYDIEQMMEHAIVHIL